MREIEIKARVKDKTKLFEALNSRGIKLTQPIKQHDVVYGMEGVKDNAPGSIWLRLRVEDNSRAIFTLKKQHRGGLDSIEYETVVEDRAEAENIVKTLGFTLYSDLTKTRQKAKLGKVEICVDDVQDLGCFIEAEMIADVDADGDEVESELWTALKGFGVSEHDEVLEGYDVLHRALKLG